MKNIINLNIQEVVTKANIDNYFNGRQSLADDVDTVVGKLSTSANDVSDLGAYGILTIITSLIIGHTIEEVVASMKKHYNLNLEE